MAKHHGWSLKSPKGYFYHFYFRESKKEAIKAFEENMLGPEALKRYKKRGWKLVKVKLVEVINPSHRGRINGNKIKNY